MLRFLRLRTSAFFVIGGFIGDCLLLLLRVVVVAKLLHELAEVLVIVHELLVRALLLHAPVLQHDHVRASPDKLQLVGDEDDLLALLLQAADHVLKDVAPGLRVHSRQDVVEQVHVRVAVHRPRERHPLLLPSAEVDALLADLREISARELADVGLESARSDDVVVAGHVHGLPEEDVASESVVHDPGTLGAVGDAAIHAHSHPLARAGVVLRRGGGGGGCGCCCCSRWRTIEQHRRRPTLQHTLRRLSHGYGCRVAEVAAPS
mmetsp:Transcript_9380/g.18305  ORF Transcript_9380/g.18305 Transcript_9380/m.18305 type:complete len:263 (-) Transcript_9380:1724-2512(-)